MAQKQPNKKIPETEKQNRIFGAGIGGAIFGASIGGPIGAIIGGTAGLLIGTGIITEQEKEEDKNG